MLRRLQKLKEYSKKKKPDMEVVTQLMSLTLFDRRWLIQKLSHPIRGVWNVPMAPEGRVWGMYTFNLYLTILQMNMQALRTAYFHAEFQIVAGQLIKIDTLFANY